MRQRSFVLHIARRFCFGAFCTGFLAGSPLHHENLYDLVVSLKEKNKLQKAGERPDLEEEYKILLQAANAQEQCYRDDIDYMASSVEKLLAAMEGYLEKQ